MATKKGQDMEEILTMRCELTGITSKKETTITLKVSSKDEGKVPALYEYLNKQVGISIEPPQQTFGF